MASSKAPTPGKTIFLEIRISAGLFTGASLYLLNETRQLVHGISKQYGSLQRYLREQ